MKVKELRDKLEKSITDGMGKYEVKKNKNPHPTIPILSYDKDKKIFYI